MSKISKYFAVFHDEEYVQGGWSWRGQDTINQVEDLLGSR
jgi:hypothetical protein